MSYRERTTDGRYLSMLTYGRVNWLTTGTFRFSHGYLDAVLVILPVTWQVIETRHSSSQGGYFATFVGVLLLL
jgi:hypothetical protein